MKFNTIFLFAASSVLAAPVFWSHPNVQVSLDAPQLPFGQVIDIDLADLTTQNPQNQIWFTGGLVGYFSNEWKAPIWTVPWVDWRLEPRESETPLFFPSFDPPVTPPRPFADPPDPERVIIHPYIAPPAPLSTDNPPDFLPPDNRRLDVSPDPSAITGVPEPNLSAMLGVLLAVTFGASRMRNRPR